MKTTGEWILLIHSETVLPPGWAIAFLKHYKNKENAGDCNVRFYETALIE